MKIAVKALIAVGLVAAATAVAIIEPMGAPQSGAAGLLPKDQSRLPAGRADGSPIDHADNLLELAQAVKSSGRHLEPVNLTVAEAGLIGASPDGFGPLEGAGPGHGFMHPPMETFTPVGPVPTDRRACAEAIDRGAGMAGYLRSKLQLVGAQQDAWQKIEEAAAPVVAEMREICATLPDEPGAPPNLPARITAANQKLAVRAAFVHAILPPVTALYDLLSAEQRAILDQPPPPPFL